ncbi:TetR/AcrR family transcriptional regulator [Nitratireductor soli]|uniref:TetR/AcrR family transcriptional regulator n=1 Tax=Nitratireductor soli TaxID=1670619 RepID=UPI00065E3F93|nr:TetR/AcrR family transcriptional regulator [Nitratireductor soli]
MRKVDPQKHAARRRAILVAARSCFARNGFHGTSTAEICAAAGMSPGNLFHYFPNKPAIIAAIVEEEGGETEAYFAGLMQRDDLHAALGEFMDMILDLAGDADYASLTLEISAEAMRDAAIGDLVERNDARLRAALTRLLGEAARRGQVDRGLDAQDAARWIAVLIDGIFNRVAVEPGFAPRNLRDGLHLLLGRVLRAGEGA